MIDRARSFDEVSFDEIARDYMAAKDQHAAARDELLRIQAKVQSAAADMEKARNQMMRFLGRNIPSRAGRVDGKIVLAQHLDGQPPQVSVFDERGELIS